MLKPDQLTTQNIANELDIISREMMKIINEYNLKAPSQLDVIDMARDNITDIKDYIRFLELSLEGRIYGDIAQEIEKSLSNNLKH